MTVEQDTIAAIATVLGEASIGIVRVSGPSAKQIVYRTFRSPSGNRTLLGAEKKMLYGYVVDPDGDQLIDECILLWMPGPRSYTTEDVVEFQLHGSIQVVQCVLRILLQSGARMAEPGEFTKRAFLNGRIDLSQAEAVIDLIRAKTDFASRAALYQVKGRLRDDISQMRRKLIAVQAHVEVTIDYPEHDVESVACSEVVDVCTDLMVEIESLIASARVGQILREGVTTVIVGRPNVGKSSLLNALLRRERAIVTDVPGTTRDVIEEFVNIRGIPLRLMDTAGIRETDDIVEKIGVNRSREMIQEAELTLIVLNCSEPLQLDDLRILAETVGQARIVIFNKTDLPEADDFSKWNESMAGAMIVRISAKSGEGISLLEESVEQLILGGQVSTQDMTYMTNERQATLLEMALVDLSEALAAARAGATLDLIAVQLQAVYAELGLVIGEEVQEDLLDEIFSKFCLGK